MGTMDCVGLWGTWLPPLPAYAVVVWAVSKEPHMWPDDQQGFIIFVLILVIGILIVT